LACLHSWLCSLFRAIATEASTPQAVIVCINDRAHPSVGGGLANKKKGMRS
jgi:hypothetical protein